MGEEKKKLCVFIADTLRTLIKSANEIEIQKEDIVQIMKDNGQYYLIYYA